MKPLTNDQIIFINKNNTTKHKWQGLFQGYFNEFRVLFRYDFQNTKDFDVSGIRSTANEVQI